MNILHSRSQGFRLGLALFLMFAIASLAFGQASVSAGNIQGTVTDPSGAVVPNAKVTITNAGTSQVITRTTSSDGRYSTPPLTSGTYKVRAEAPSFQSAEQSVTVQVGVSASANFKLTLGASSQTVEVTTEAERVNTEQPTVQGVLTSQQIEQLPVNGRNFLDLAQLEPGVQIQDGGNFDPTKNGFSSISFGGRAGRTARINVDGIDISDETVGTTTQNISAGAISEFQLSQSTLDLSTELTSSGAVNVSTKSGTNVMHGEGLYLGRFKPYGFAKFPGDTSGDGVRYERNQMGGSLGGAIIKDKMFFFINGERTKQDQQIAIVPDGIFKGVLPNTYPAFFRDNTADAKLDYQGPHGMHLFYRLGYHTANAAYAYGSTYQPFANRDQTPAHTVGADFSTGKFTHSIRFGYFKFQNHIADAVLGNNAIYNPGATAAFPVDIRIGPAGVAERFGPSRLAPQATFQSNHQIKWDSSYLAGNHIIRFGVDFNAIRGGGFASFYGLAPEIRTANNAAAQAAAAGGPFPGGALNPLNYQVSSLLIGNGQGYFTEQAAFGFPAGGQQDNRFAFYVGDSWKIRSRLTLTYGVRYSRDTGRADSDLAPLTCDQIDPTYFSQLPCTGKALILDQFGGNYGGRVRQPNNNWGPQIGFAWDPTGSGKTSIRGGTGLYYENAVFNNVLFDRPGRLPKGLFWGTAPNPCSGGTLLGSSTFTYNGTPYDIATQICGQPVGNVMSIVGAMQVYYQQQIAAQGATANPNFLGLNLANGNNSTGNNFIAPNYKTPMSIQMNLGIQHELKPGMIVSADFIRNVGLHYLLAVDTNHIGDARYFNKTAATNAIAATLAACGVGTVDAAIAACPGLHPATATTPVGPATIYDFAANGLDSGASYLYGYPSTAFFLDPSQGAAFPGINPLVGENTMMFPIGRSVYTGLELKLQHRVARHVRGLSGFNYTLSYSFSRFNTMTGDQDFVNTASDFRAPNRYFGPGSLDRTHQLSFGGTFQIAHHGPELSFIGHIFSPLSVTPFLDEENSSAQIFTSDLTGDGTWGDILPGTKNGSFGRDYNGSGINNAINSYNQNYGGQLTPAGQVLVSSGLLTQAQLVALGATAYTVAPAPSDQAGLGWLKTVDLKMDWPIKIGERFTLHPNIGFYNAFNFANFDSASNLMSGALYGGGGSINGTSKALGDHDTTRTGAGTGVNTIGAPRQMEFGLRFTF